MTDSPTPKAARKANRRLAGARGSALTSSVARKLRARIRRRGDLRFTLSLVEKEIVLYTELLTMLRADKGKAPNALQRKGYGHIENRGRFEAFVINEKGRELAG